MIGCERKQVDCGGKHNINIQSKWKNFFIFFFVCVENIYFLLNLEQKK